MIDTNKYEGHTDDYIWTWKHYASHFDHDADRALIQDAPLLLAEVERHRPPKVDGKYMAWSDSHPKYDRRTWIEQVMEGITDVGYWTWVNWQLQYGEEGE